MDQLVFNYRPVPSDCLCSSISCSLTIVVVVVVDSSDGRGDSEYIVHKFMALFIKDLFLESTRKPPDAAAVDLRIDSLKSQLDELRDQLHKEIDSDFKDSL